MTAVLEGSAELCGVDGKTQRLVCGGANVDVRVLRDWRADTGSPGCGWGKTYVHVYIYKFMCTAFWNNIYCKLHLRPSSLLAIFMSESVRYGHFAHTCVGGYCFCIIIPAHNTSYVYVYGACC